MASITDLKEALDDDLAQIASNSTKNDADFDMKQGNYQHNPLPGGTPFYRVDSLLETPVAIVVRSGCAKCEDFETRIKLIAEPAVLHVDTLSAAMQDKVLHRLEELTGDSSLPRVFIHGTYLVPPNNDIHKVDLGPRIHGANAKGLSALVNRSTPAGMTTVSIDFEGEMSTMEVDATRWMGGIFKSKLMQHLGVSGKLSSFIVTCGGESFRGREPIASLPNFSPGCTVHIRRRALDEDAPRGTT